MTDQNLTQNETPTLPALKKLTCKECGATLTSTMKFCSSCGKKIEIAPSEKTVFCKKCGEKLAVGAKFCPMCGEPHSAASPTSPALPKESATRAVGVPPLTAAPTQSVAAAQKSPSTQPTTSIEAQQPPARTPCRNCGVSLPITMAFCPKCGKKQKYAAATPVSKKRLPKKWLILIFAAVFITVSSLTSVLVSALVNNNKKPALDEIYLTHCSSRWATLGKNGEYLEIDTNPHDREEYMDFDAYDAIETVNNALGLPGYLFNDMGKTTALMGRQTETFEDAHISVSWNYHPDNGLEVTYKVIK